MPTLGTKIKELRQEKGLTQDQLAQAMSVTKGTISVWERDLKTPSFAKLDDLCGLFNVNMAFLLGTSTERNHIARREEELDRLGAEASQEEDLKTLRHYARMMAELSESSKRIVYAAIKEAYRVDKENEALKAQQ